MGNRLGSKAMLVAAALLAGAGCQVHSQQAGTEPAVASRSATETSTTAPSTPALTVAHPTAATGISDLSASDLHDVLSYLDNGHHDKMKLAFWVSTPLRSADPVFKQFYKEMGAQQKALAAEVESWAKTRHVDLTYRDGTDTFGKAQTIMSNRQEKTVRADGKEDFGRDMLVDEFQDYEFSISLISALLPSVHDQALRSYLEKSLHMHEAASLQIQGLLKRFKFAG